ncbi:DNRLRE domain-containing protein [Streptomyces sp.]|uniref:DNRLRE domain-containing protein n=1 Tax=Streptomyces sp. TaxID=1931 RepID=UPI002811C4AD|nr:DNRLRE domain-containing protein [Streptomyces sp.]
MRRSLTRLPGKRSILAASGGLALAASLLVPATASSTPDVPELKAEPVAATAVPTVTPMAQTGPRNIIKRLQDTYISSADNADHSQGHILHVGTPDNGVTKYRSFMRFDVSKLRGAPIKQATLRVYNSFVSDCSANAWMGVHPVTSAWDQATITWANQPTVGAGKGTWFGVGHPNCPDVTNKNDPAASNGIQRIDVTDWVKGWADTSLPNHGIRFSAAESGTSGYKDFCSMNPVGTDYACHAAYNAPTLEVEFNEGHTPIISGNEFGPTYPNNYPAAHAALEFFDSTNPSVWTSSGPYQRWIPDAYHSVFDASLKGDAWKGGTSHKLRPGGPYGGTVLVTGDGGSGFVGVIPYPSLAGYHWAINVGTGGNLHGVEMLPNGNVVVAFSDAVPGAPQGGVAVYTRAQGAPGAWNAASPRIFPLEDAHEVSYDPASGALWAVGGKQLVKYAYSGGELAPPHEQDTFDLPKQSATGDAWGHDLGPVYGNSDRLWVASNGGITQFSKSGSVRCHFGTNDSRWPKAAYVQGAEHRWCKDYANEPVINSRGLVKSVGDDPASGVVVSTCSGNLDACPETQMSHPDALWTSAYMRFVAGNGTTTIKAASSSDRHYKATWAVPAYQ